MTDEQQQRPPMFLSMGSHHSSDGRKCAMELAAWLAGEEHSDHPECVSPVIGTMMRHMNDLLPDDARQQLLPYVLRSIGTTDTAATKHRRETIYQEWRDRHSDSWPLVEVDGTAVRWLAPITEMFALLDDLIAVGPGDPDEPTVAIAERVRAVRGVLADASQA